MDSPVSWAALGLSILTAVYAIFASTPKEMNRRVGKLEISDAKRESDIANIIKIMDRLVRTVDKYIEFRTERNGKG